MIGFYKQIINLIKTYKMTDLKLIDDTYSNELVNWKENYWSYRKVHTGLWHRSHRYYNGGNGIPVDYETMKEFRPFGVWVLKDKNCPNDICFGCNQFMVRHYNYDKDYCWINNIQFYINQKAREDIIENAMKEDKPKESKKESKKENNEENNEIIKLRKENKRLKRLLHNLQ